MQSNLPPLEKLATIIVSSYSRISFPKLVTYLVLPQEDCLSLCITLVNKGIFVNIDNFSYLEINAINIPLLDLPRKYDSPFRKKSYVYGHIYAVELDAIIKVGFSRQSEIRVKSYSTGNLFVEQLFISKNLFTISDEKAFHRLHNHGKEQYSLDRKSELLDLLRAFDSEVANDV